MTTVLLLKSLALVLALLVLGTLALGAYGASLWSRATSDLIVRLNATRTPLGQVRFDPATLIELPLPVQRYFRAALASGQPLVAAADCTHTGSFNASDGDARWSRFRSIHHVVVSRPGFV
jgi:hypothetical protein